MKTVEPKLASGICILIIFNVAFMIELAGGFPLVSEYIKFVCIVTIIMAVIVYIKSDSKYVQENNDNAKALIFGSILGLLLIILTYIFWM